VPGCSARTRNEPDSLSRQRPARTADQPQEDPETIAATQWAVGIRAAGHEIIVPAIADYEIRRELERAGKTRGLARLDAWNGAAPGRYLSVTDTALRLAAKLWAQAGSAGMPTADPKELDGDVLIAAQALDLGLPASGFIIATTNAGHVSQFAPCDLWTNITP
jgi:predicted nucleic acid-binding protein